MASGIKHADVGVQLARSEWTGIDTHEITYILIPDGAGHYLRLPQLTTAQRNALTPVNGMMIYNSTTTQAEAYQDDSWGAVGASVVSNVAYDESTWNGVTTIAPSKNAVYDELASHYAVTNEPTGFPNRTDSDLSFVSGTRTFTVAPSGASFDYYILGVKYTVSSSDDIIITDTSGLHAIHYDGATLSDSVNPSDATFAGLMRNKALVALIYWNATDGAAYVLADERHGCIMSGRTHQWMHFAIGAVWRNGLTISGYTEDEEDNDSSLTLYLTNGGFYDEDIELDIVDGAAANQYEQQLNGSADAEIPILYRDDVDGSWKEDAATTLPYKTGGTGRLAYNKDDGDGTFSQVEVTDNKWVAATLIATNDWQCPIKMVQGQNEYTDKKTAIEEATDEIIAWGTMLSPEIVVLYRFVLNTKDTYGSTPKCKIEADGITDFRGARLIGTAAVAQDHGSLAGLADDDHALYIKDSEFTAADEIMVGTGSGTFGQVTLAASQFLAKKSAGAATNVTAAEARAILNVADGAIANIVEDTTPQLGGTLEVLENSVQLDNTIGTEDHWSGITCPGTAGTALLFGQLCYLANADDKWELADADAEATAGDVKLGICILAANEDAATELLLYGFIKDSTHFDFDSGGDAIYAHTTPGGIGGTRPSGSGDIVRVVGYATEDAYTIFFNPSGMWLEI